MVEANPTNPPEQSQNQEAQKDAKEEVKEAKIEGATRRPASKE